MLTIIIASFSGVYVNAVMCAALYFAIAASDSHPALFPVSGKVMPELRRPGDITMVYTLGPACSILPCAVRDLGCSQPPNLSVRGSASGRWQENELMGGTLVDEYS